MRNVSGRVRHVSDGGKKAARVKPVSNSCDKREDAGVGTVKHVSNKYSE